MPTVQVEQGRASRSGPEVFVSILSALGLARDPAIFTTDPTTGAFGARLRQNVPTGTIEAPLLIAQGQTDPLVLPGVQQRYAAQRCADGQQLEYRTYPDRDHVGLVTADSPLIPDLLGWTQARFAAAPATSNCPSLWSARSTPGALGWHEDRIVPMPA